MKSVPRPLLLRFLVLIVIVVTGFAVLRWTPVAQYLTTDQVSAFLNRLRGVWWAPVALILSYVVLCPLGVPASPMMIAGGVVFGPWWGSLYNVLGTFLGGAMTYFLGRGLGRDLVRHLVGHKLKRVEMVPIEQIVTDSARQNSKRPAYVTLAVPDEVVKSLKGSRDDRDLVLLVRVPKEILERSESRILLPGEVR